MTRATLNDVAAKAGVSAKTVSRVVNGEPHVSDEVRDAVGRAIDELAYRPNLFARSLKSARSFLIGLFIDDPTSGYAAGLQHGALGQCRTHGYHLVVEPVNLAGPDLTTRIARDLATLRLAGAIVAPPACDDLALRGVLRAAQLPVILITPDRSTDLAGFGIVEIDDVDAARVMTRHLIELGHRDIGIIKGPANHGVSIRRLMGYRMAMEEAGIPVNEAWIGEGAFDFRSGLEAGARLLAGADRPTAIFASNDDMALGVFIAATQAGIAVPQGLSIAGFDDAATSRITWPQITTIAQPRAEMAAAAVDMLVNTRDRADLPDLTFAHSLMVRGSTAPLARM